MRRLGCVVAAVVAGVGGAVPAHAQEGATRAAATAANTSPLVHEVTLNAPVEEAWKVFSTDEGFKKLGVAQAKIDFRVGGKMLTHYNPPDKGTLGDEGTIENTVLAFEPMRMVAWHITKPPKGF